MLNIPNLLSVSRIISIPLFIILLIYQFYGWALLIFITAGVSDALDGLLARLLHQRTILGAYLDPAADKLLLASSYITLAILNILPGWLSVIVISRDVIICLGILILFLTSHPLKIQPSVASKLNTGFQTVTVGFALFSKYAFPLPIFMDFLIWSTAFLTILSGGQYIWRGIKIFSLE
ncbi:MAG: CDP-alcohol phosphatidyltransferase family protein [Thermodesulfobacteriota bacterium]|nr:CDP-alcohol phosphatidyltransferase family protein [Thermodesulfobacteriota bacterium]